MTAPLVGALGAPRVNATRFRQAHEADWSRLEQIVTRMEKRSIRSLGDDDLLALPALYRTTLSSLSVARDTSLDRALVTYLERLSTRAYFQIYGVQTPALRQLARFFARGWPEAVRSLWRETVFCVAAHLRRRATRVSPDPERSELVLQHHPARHGGGPRSVDLSPGAAGDALCQGPALAGGVRDLPVHPQQPDRDLRVRARCRAWRCRPSC